MTHIYLTGCSLYLIPECGMGTGVGEALHRAFFKALSESWLYHQLPGCLIQQQSKRNSKTEGEPHGILIRRTSAVTNVLRPSGVMRVAHMVLNRLFMHSSSSSVCGSLFLYGATT